MIVGTVGTAWLWQAKSIWFPFVVMMVWTLMCFWDMYLRPVFAPETEAEDENIIEHQLSDWIGGRTSKYEGDMDNVKNRQLRLEKELDLLRTKFDNSKKDDK